MIDEPVRAHDDPLRGHRVPEGMQDDDPVTDDDAIDQGLVVVSEPIGILPLEIGQDLLDQRATVGAALPIREHRPIGVIVRFEEFPDPALRHDGVQPLELVGDLLEEGRVLGHEAGLESQPTVATQLDVPQMHQHVVQREHPHVAGEALDPDRRTGLRRHQVEEVVGVVERALALDRELRTELVGDVPKGPLEVGRELTGIPPGRPPTHAVTFDEQHPPGGGAKREERRRDARDPGTHDGDIGGRIRIERSRWTIRFELRDPRRSVRLISIVGGHHRSVSETSATPWGKRAPRSRAPHIVMTILPLA